MSETPDSTTDVGANDIDGLSALGALSETSRGHRELPLDEILMMTTGIVVAFVGSSRQMPEGGLPALIASTYAALADLEGTALAKEAADAP